MALVVEDGTGLTNANSLASVAFSNSYFADRNNTTWTDNLDDIDDKPGLLIKATDFMLQVYHLSWDGYRRYATQSLDWPRVWVPEWDFVGSYGPAPRYIDPTIVPTFVQQACCELAYRASIADLAPDIERIVRSEKVGNIEVTYDPNSPAFTTYRAVNNLLSRYFGRNSGNNAKMYRT